MKVLSTLKRTLLDMQNVAGSFPPYTLKLGEIATEALIQEIEEVENTFTTKTPVTFCHNKGKRFTAFNLTIKGHSEPEFFCPHCDKKVGTDAYSNSHEVVQ